MGLFSFTQEIAMDLGTANTIILNNGKIVVDEPSVVALDRRTDKMIAVGERAKMMYEKENPNIRTVRPLRDGVIADFNACEQMMRGLIKKVNMGNRFFSPSLRMVIGVPSGSTEVELRAVRDSAEHAGGRDVYLIFEPMAAAIGIGIDVEAPEGNMIVDIGGGSTEIAVISLGGIVSNNSIRIAGDDLSWLSLIRHARREPLSLYILLLVMTSHSHAHPRYHLLSRYILYSHPESALLFPYPPAPPPPSVV